MRFAVGDKGDVNILTNSFVAVNGNDLRKKREIRIKCFVSFFFISEMNTQIIISAGIEEEA